MRETVAKRVRMSTGTEERHELPRLETARWKPPDVLRRPVLRSSPRWRDFSSGPMTEATKRFINHKQVQISILGKIDSCRSGA